MARNRGSGIPATVEFSEYLGGTRYIYTRLADGQHLTVEDRTNIAIANGQSILLSMPARKGLAFNGSGGRIR
jgi:lactose/L-arabinose transport system ATP-binding protein